MSPPTPPTVVHVGLHKTATTSLQMNLFRHGARRYSGLHGAPGWQAARRDWVPTLMAGGDMPAQAAGKPFKVNCQCQDACERHFSLTSWCSQIERPDS